LREIEAADCEKTAIFTVGSLETLRKIEAADCEKPRFSPSAASKN
jgi:hypothetical protein